MGGDESGMYLIILRSTSRFSQTHTHTEVLEQTVIPLKRSREIRERERNQVLELAKSLDVRLKRDSKSEDITMLRQGNMDFYSNDNLIYRKMLRSTKEIFES